ncbi:hypothetical protein [Microvirga tunisiensis]|uniref:hypothetical protein n=1 Tax=Microvirga tunisiensis TaxID=2108360 RepID=UPI00129C933C|nr:hypothetical protein [Microvirga tunisiensis]
MAKARQVSPQAEQVKSIPFERQREIECVLVSPAVEDTTFANGRAFLRQDGVTIQ